MKLPNSIILIIFILGLLLNSCKKDKINFRDKYIGKYSVSEKINSYGSPICGDSYSREKDTIIFITYGETDTTLNVLGRDVYLNSTGYYSDYHYGLRLWNDSIHSLFMNGGIGCGQNETYTGFRISNKP